MLDVQKLREFTKGLATPPHKLKAFDDGMRDMHTRHPDRWVVYTALWHEGEGRYEFVVHGAFDTLKEAMDSTWGLTDIERSRRTVTSTRLPAGYCVGSNVRWLPTETPA